MWNLLIYFTICFVSEAILKKWKKTALSLSINKTELISKSPNPPSKHIDSPIEVNEKIHSNETKHNNALEYVEIRENDILATKMYNFNLDNLSNQYHAHNQQRSSDKSVTDQKIVSSTKAVIQSIKNYSQIQMVQEETESEAPLLSSSSLPFETGIECKDRTIKPRMEMRGTNYWVLYNYIPAEEVTRYFCMTCVGSLLWHSILFYPLIKFQQNWNSKSILKYILG